MLQVNVLDFLSAKGLDNHKDYMVVPVEMSPTLEILKNNGVHLVSDATAMTPDLSILSKDNELLGREASLLIPGWEEQLVTKLKEIALEFTYICIVDFVKADNFGYGEEGRTNTREYMVAPATMIANLQKLQEKGVFLRMHKASLGGLTVHDKDGNVIGFVRMWGVPETYSWQEELVRVLKDIAEKL